MVERWRAICAVSGYLDIVYRVRQRMAQFSVLRRKQCGRNENMEEIGAQSHYAR